MTRPSAGGSSRRSRLSSSSYFESDPEAASTDAWTVSRPAARSLTGTTTNSRTLLSAKCSGGTSGRLVSSGSRQGGWYVDAGCGTAAV